MTEKAEREKRTDVGSISAHCRKNNLQNVPCLGVSGIWDILGFYFWETKIDPQYKLKFNTQEAGDMSHIWDILSS